MSVGAVCVRNVQIASRDETVREVAKRMAAEGVGTVVVVGDSRRPLGILTDRDVTTRCVAEGRDPDATTVAEAMSGPISCVQESMPIEDALERMARVEVRRLAVVDAEGRLVGLLALDDVLELLAEEAATIGRLLGRRSRRPRA